MMFLELLAAVALAGGALACVVAAALHPRGRAARLFLAAALACAAAAELLDTGDFQLTIAACVLAAVGAALLFLNRHVAVTRLSRLDAAMAASATAALAVSLGAPAPGAFAAAAIAGVIGLARWRPGVPVVLAVAGLAALGLGEAVTPAAAVLLGTAAWLRTPGADPGPEFSPVVLTAIITFALIALTLLSLGQFAEIADVAVALAIVTVLTGMARAGFTVIERLRESRQLALTDELTGLGNRRHLIQRLDAAVAACAQDGRELALLLVDLDGFKELNDTLGHHAGDQVLRQIGPRLNGLLRSGDTLARLGGDEFAVVLVPADEASASTAGLRLRSALEQSFEVGGIRVHIDASVGIAIYPEHEHSALGLLQRADVAMYEAKRMRTGHEVYLPGRDRNSRERLELVGELHGALNAGELVLHYQPKAEIRTGAVRGVEALVRWRHPQRGLLGPTHFLPLVEQSGLTRALTAFVLDRAVEEIGTQRAAGFDLDVAVNLGPADLLDLGLPSEVRRILDLHGFSPENLQLEVSEDVVMADAERTVDVLAGLRQIGVRTALDDFGAGHSALAHLRDLRLDELKIDRSFVMRIHDECDAAIVHSVIDLGQRLGLKVVAEGVETEEAWVLLAGWGCDEAQGHLLSRPMPIDDLATWLRELARRPHALPDPRLWAALH
jgi:diguanylate cyclase (GGDEF)-like protein